MRIRMFEVDDDDYYWVHVFYQSKSDGRQVPGYQNQVYQCDQLDGLFKLLKRKGIIK